VFPNRVGVGGVRFPTNSIPPENPIMKAWEYQMIAYFLKIPNPKNPFFHCLPSSKNVCLRESIKFSHP